MAIIHDNCKCGRSITVLTDADCRMAQVTVQAFYPEDPISSKNNYNIFRCEGCGQPVHETVPSIVKAESEQEKALFQEEVKPEWVFSDD